MTAATRALRSRLAEVRSVAAAGDRRRIPEWGLLLVGVIGVLPLLAVSLRLGALRAALPGPLQAIGDGLNLHLQLFFVPAPDRDVVLYVLLLPMAALLVALTRLTLGLRVLGFRAILIAIGFQEIGVLPSLMLIAVIALAVLAVRPLMRRFGLPLYARVAAILCLVAVTMTGGLLVGAALDSPSLWSFTFFPVVILAMLAESIADTVARESMGMAVWRTGVTIVLAAVIALLSQLMPLRELMLACPELIVTFLVAVVLVAELLDLRLFEDFRPGTSGQATSHDSSGLHIALVRGRFPDAVLHHRPGSAPSRYRRASLQAVIDELRDRGHQVSVVEGDALLGSHLRSALPRPLPGRPVNGLVLNFAGGVQGPGRLLQVPAVCEMLGVPYSGPDPRSPLLSGDRLHCRARLAAAGIAVPDMVPHAELTAAADYPLRVLPRWEPDRPAERVRNPRELRDAVARLAADHSEVLIERQPTGRALTLVLVQQPGDVTEVLPPLERRGRLGQWQAAQGLDATARAALENTARAAFAALACRDLARLDLVLGEDARVTFLDLRPIELPTRRGAVAAAAAAAGLSLADVVEAIAHNVLARAGESAIPQFIRPLQSAA